MIFEKREDQLEEFWRALWENWVPKDESHIPLELFTEENPSFNGGIFSIWSFKLASMEFGEEGFERENSFGWNYNEMKIGNNNIDGLNSLENKLENNSKTK